MNDDEANELRLLAGEETHLELLEMQAKRSRSFKELNP